ncbi:MAG: hypothetical protein V3V08_21145 [Nannocystaceae bacterium]
MGFVRCDRVVKVAGANLDALGLRPEDYYVLSRVDGAVTTDELILATGLDRVEAEAILDRLTQIGALAFAPSGHRTPPQTKGHRLGTSEPRPGSSDLRERTRERKWSTIRAQLAGTDRPGRETARVPVPEQEREQEAAPVDHHVPDTGEIEYPTAADDDPRIERGLDLPIDVQRVVLALGDDEQALYGPFRRLGIPPVDDAKAVRRAYHLASRMFHPDRYYGRELGAFSSRLGSAFEAIRDAYEELIDDARRAARLRSLQKSHVQPPTAERSTRDPLRSRQREAHEKATATLRDRARARYEKGRTERAAGRAGAAASLFRIAMELDADNPEYESSWRACLEQARQQRAARSFATALRHVGFGNRAEAAHFFLDAAEADPQPRYLAEAAAALASTDNLRSREFAMAALQGLVRRDAATSTLVRGRVHHCCAVAFVAAAQVHSAKQQAELAVELLPDDTEAAALLKSIKLT